MELSRKESTRGVVAMEKCCVSGRLGLLAGEGRRKADAELGIVSSNRSRTTTLGSVEARLTDRPNGGVGNEMPDIWDCKLNLRLETAEAVAYSGKSAKLSGVTTTP